MATASPHSPYGTKQIKGKADKRVMGLAFSKEGPVWSVKKLCISPSQYARSYEIDVREGVASYCNDHIDDFTINVGDG